MKPMLLKTRTFPESREEGRDQESIQLSATPDPGYQIEKQHIQ